MASGRARGLPLLARGHPWGAELAHWPGTGWAFRKEGPRSQGFSPDCDSPVPKKGLTEKFLGGRVRASRPNVRCWVQRTPLGAQRSAWETGCTFNVRQSQSTIQKSKNQTHFSHLAPGAVEEAGGLPSPAGDGEGQRKAREGEEGTRPQGRHCRILPPRPSLGLPGLRHLCLCKPVLVRPCLPGPAHVGAGTSHIISPSSPAPLMLRSLFPLWILSRLLDP